MPMHRAVHRDAISLSLLCMLGAGCANTLKPRLRPGSDIAMTARPLGAGAIVSLLASHCRTADVGPATTASRPPIDQATRGAAGVSENPQDAAPRCEQAVGGVAPDPSTPKPVPVIKVP